MNQHPSNHTNGCKLHMVTDCGCPGYPSLQNVLRDCGNNCGDYRQQDRCIRCQAAAMIDRYKTRSERYLERILHLQETVDRYEHIRDITTQAWATQPPSWKQN